MAKIKVGSGAGGWWESNQGDLLGNGEEASAIAPAGESWLWRDKDKPVVETSHQGRLGKAREEIHGNGTCHEPKGAAGDGLLLVMVGWICQPKSQPEALWRKANLFGNEQNLRDLTDHKWKLKEEEEKSV